MSHECEGCTIACEAIRRGSTPLWLTYARALCPAGVKDSIFRFERNGRGSLPRQGTLKISNEICDSNTLLLYEK
jgi:hypothetical protein